MYSPKVDCFFSEWIQVWRHFINNTYNGTAKSLQLCSTLCDPRDGSPPGSPVPGILQARTLEWLAISFSNAWMWKVQVKSLSRVWLFATPGTAVYQAPPSMGFARQESWSGVPVPSLWAKWPVCKLTEWHRQLSAVGSDLDYSSPGRRILCPDHKDKKRRLPWSL